MTKHTIISFDLDDTLWHNAPVIKQAEQACYQSLCHQLPNFEQHCSLEKMREWRLKVLADRPELIHQVSYSRIESLKQMLNSMKINAADTIATIAFEQFQHARNRVDLYPGAISCLTELSESHTLIGLTNGNSQPDKMPIGKYFEFVIDAESINSSKPDPKHFIEAARRLECDISDMIHIGDHPIDDIFAANELGIKTIWVNHQGMKWQQDFKYSAMATDLTQVPLLITELIK